MHTIVITGGHHNSALVVAREIIARGHQVIWIGHRYSSRGDTVDSAEYVEVTAAGIPFHDLVAAKLLPSLTELIRFPTGLFKTLTLLKTLRPTAVLSFGGYLGGTVALVGKYLHIPIYLHEQTVTAGRANKLIGKLSRHIFLTWPQSAKYFDKVKTEIVGLPLRPGIFSAKAKKLFTRHKPTLLVMGGKQGAHVINQFVFTNLDSLLTSFNIVHQTGTSSLTRDYDKALALKNSLKSLSDCYLPQGYVTESEIGQYLQSSDIYLGRSGAHICYELGVIGKPSILVPLMSTHDFEQQKNAKILVDAKLGSIIYESSLSFENVQKSYLALSKIKPKTIALPRNASTILVDHLLADLH